MSTATNRWGEQRGVETAGMVHRFIAVSEPVKRDICEIMNVPLKRSKFCEVNTPVRMHDEQRISIRKNSHPTWNR